MKFNLIGIHIISLNPTNTFLIVKFQPENIYNNLKYHKILFYTHLSRNDFSGWGENVLWSLLLCLTDLTSDSNTDSCPGNKCYPSPLKFLLNIPLYFIKSPCLHLLCLTYSNDSFRLSSYTLHYSEVFVIRCHFWQNIYINKSKL